MTIIKLSCHLSSNRVFPLQFKSHHSGGLQFLSGTTSPARIHKVIPGTRYLELNNMGSDGLFDTSR